MMNSTIAYIGLGSNEGDRRLFIQSAAEMLAGVPGCRLCRQSRVIETQALGDAGGTKYLNTVAEIETSLTPEGLLKAMQDIELRLGRVRVEKWGPRTVDLDLLLYGERVVCEPSLTVPHRQLHLRSFVLAGLAELCPERVHPVLRRDMQTLAGRLNGQNYFVRPDMPRLISIAGLIGVGKTTLTRGLANALAGQAIYEEFDKNPYLAEVYAGHTELALDSELYFLGSSVRQLSPESLNGGRIYVNDYVFEKALIYARSWLAPEMLAEYEMIYPEQHKKAVVPTAVIYLEDTVEHCLQRIHQRHRPFEQGIQPEFLANLERWYNELFERWTACPVIRVRAEECRLPEQVETLAREISWYVTHEEKDRCTWSTQ
ncbi:MAG TPA: 2-amino-4-hydroxy-6-hydroxymethyldihydropteridine diphosphokinase [Anaerohalosphaeraceae bacterium]|nr:2-amino-4-hydroxy-6-hydroxymethyldihydropteridine diphosphokinase [Anaerohalosphaeraceae bacterium]